jgi:CRISPR system Cascade subunit CasD
VTLVSEHLVFLLYAPLGAMGGVAVGERRGGFDRPAKSSILGLVAASLGLERSDEPGHLALAEAFGLGLGEIAPGRLLMDYHTTQAPPRRTNRHFRTRQEEVEVDDLGTSISLREYRTDPAHIVVLWRRGASRWSLTELAESLRRPRFVMYFGRKACPLGLPLDPKVIEANNARAAIRVYLAGRTPEQAELLRDLRLAGPPLVLALDVDAADRSNEMRVEHRRDQIESRQRWQFGLRSEVLLYGGKDD